MPHGAHPHSRGENVNDVGAALAARGSSPLTRGKLLDGAQEVPELGLIPTHAGKTAPYLRPISPYRAHPHSRGENQPRRAARLHVWGSSPLTRGKPGVPGDSGQGHGLIPTHAGKTGAGHEYHDSCEAHPHSRGENGWASHPWRTDQGSSPLTRGKLLVGAGDNLAGGLIPTHAGKTRGVSVVPQASGAHPHSRGENVR